MNIWFIAVVAAGMALQALLLLWTRKDYPLPKKWQAGAVLATGAALAFLRMNYEIIQSAPASAALPLSVVVFIAIAAIDFKHYLIPNRLSGLSWVLALAFVAGFFGQIGRPLLYGGIALLAIFILFFILSRGSLGMGDVKIAGPMGLFIGISQVPQFLVWTFVLGAAVSLVLLLTKIRKKDDKIAFGPYMVMGFLILWIF